MSTLSSPLSPFVAHSQDLSNFVFGMNEVFGAMKRMVGRVMGVVLFPLAVIAVAFFWLVLKFQYRKLKRLYGGARAINGMDYAQIRTEFDVLDAASHKISMAASMPADRLASLPFLLRGVVGLIVKLSQLINQRRDSLAQVLADIDNSAPQTDLLVPRMEADLWTSRNSVYQFRF